jgi:transposase
LRPHDSEEQPIQSISTIGLDIAKPVFQVHGVDAAGQVVLRRQLRRRHVLAFFQKLPPCLVRIEACASSHHWPRELQALGHTVRLMSPAYVKPYVKRQKNDRRVVSARKIPVSDSVETGFDDCAVGS